MPEYEGYEYEDSEGNPVYQVCPYCYGSGEVAAINIPNVTKLMTADKLSLQIERLEAENEALRQRVEALEKELRRARTGFTMIENRAGNATTSLNTMLDIYKLAKRSNGYIHKALGAEQS